MKKRRRLIFKIIILGIEAAIISVCLYQLRSIKAKHEKLESIGVLTLQEDVSVTFEILEQVDENYLLGGYQIFSNQQANIPGMEKRAETNLVVVNFPVTEFVPALNQLQSEDVKGCIVSSETMYTLFGTANSIGQNLMIHGEEYWVRGILNTDRQVVIIQYNEQNDLYRESFLDGIVFDVSKELYRNQYVNQFVNSYQYGDVEELYYTMDYLSLIGKVEIPTKWSDFEFWTDYGSNLAKRWERKLYGKKDVIELYYYQFFLRKLGTEMVFILMCILSLVAISGIVKDTTREGDRA